MKIAYVEVNNYRSIEHLELQVDKFTALIGANGSGKSTVLYAISWLLDGGLLEAEDIHGYTEDDPTSYRDKEISVKITFDSLTDNDKEKLGKYGRKAEATFKRVWYQATNESKVYGNVQQGPGFSAVLNAPSAPEMRREYRSLQSTITSLSALPGNASQQAIKDELDRWESDPGNAELLEDIESSDATNLFGFSGTKRIKDCFNFILIPASKALAEEVNGTGKGSVINELVGVMTGQAAKTAREAWIEQNSSAIKGLNTAISSHVKDATTVQVERINGYLKQYIANARIEIKPTIPDWAPAPTPFVNTTVSIDDTSNNVIRQGHGVQRAVMIAMLQAVAPDRKMLEAMYVPVDENESDDQTSARLDEMEQDLPTVCICIEEPEIYQHPIRARAFARVLRELSEDARTQVIIATHSPYFVLPEQFASLRKFGLENGKSFYRAATTADIASSAGWAEADIKKTVQKEIPEVFSEGFFADAVVLCEGPTDLVVLEEIANKLEKPFDTHGIQLLPMDSKENIVKPRAILDALGSKIYCVADADFDGANRKHPTDAQKRIDCHTSHQSKTERFLEKMPTPATSKVGSIPFRFGQPTLVSNSYTIWRDDIEAELECWPSFMSKMSENNYTIRSEKNVYAYRKCVIEADVEDMPDNLKKCIDAIHEIRTAA